MMIQHAEDFVRLLESDDPDVRKKATAATASDSTWLDIIDRYPAARRAVALTKGLPASVIARLASDDEPGVRSLVARKRKLPPGLLEQLASDSDSGVRLAVAFHPKATRAILERLSQDEWNEVALKAAQRLAEQSS